MICAASAVSISSLSETTEAYMLALEDLGNATETNQKTKIGALSLLLIGWRTNTTRIQEAQSPVQPSKL